MPAQFQVNIENLGKLSHAKVSVGNFTVLAGKNGTGKSFVSKTLYSIFSVASTNPLAVLFSPHRRSLYSARYASDKPLRADLERSVRVFDHQIRKIFVDRLNEAESEQKARSIVVKFLGDVREICQGSPENIKFLSPLRKEQFTNSLYALSSLSKTKPHELAEEATKVQIRDNLYGNFQTDQLSKLCSDGADATNFEIEEVVSLKISGKSNLHMPMKENLHVLSEFSRVVYLESPSLWKQEKTLTDYRFSVEGSNVPKFFNDLSGMLERNFHGDPICPRVLERLTSSDVMDGKIVISEAGMLFQENNGGSREMPMVAMGVANIGMLALLIDLRVLDENSFLIIDEPEAHLHPAWQMEVADALFALAKAGVNVMIATHSPDIIKYLQVHVRNNPEDENLIALNHFCAGSANPCTNDMEEDLTDVLEDLAEPYYNKYHEGIS